MKILVAGGTGMIGGHAALLLQAEGHDVAIAARKPAAAAPGSPLTKLKFVQGDYVAGTYKKSDLVGFDALVFCAGNDVRHIPQGESDATYWHKANAVAIPKFFELARDAGIKTAINVGSFYPQAAPHLVAKNHYVKSRKDSDDGIRALNSSSFRTMSINAPFVVGAVPGLTVQMFEFYTRYAEGALGMPGSAPAGGVNFISTQSLSEAVSGGLKRGEGGKAYLVGDENLTYQDYFGHFFRAVGNTKALPLPILDQEHPMLPDSAIFAGRGNTVYYEPDAAETELLGYRRKDIARAIDEIVAQYHKT
ncbi:MAG: NAD(P)-dependent oxidoreductase [Rhodospirillaceae bacterium]|nr:NAD(P)-dependent oxidoreductase [Rhodospirillaceae bacterium]